MTPWLVPYRVNPEAPVRLLCFPCAGMGASMYRSLALALPGWVEVLGVQPPGRAERYRECAFTQMAGLVEVLTSAIAPWFDRPFVIFGHSLGALTGFEVALRLRREGLPGPRHFVASGHRAPHLAHRHEPLGHLEDATFVAELRRRYDGIPEGVLRNPELMELVLPTLRADLRLLEDYAYRSARPLDCPITCFGGLADAEARREELDAWGAHTTKEFQVCMFPGGHFFLQSAQAQVVDAVVSIVNTIVDQAGAGGRPA